MDSLYMRQQLMSQMMPQMAMAMSLAATAAGPMIASGMDPSQIGMMLGLNAGLAMGWASYAGGMSGMSQMYNNMGSYGNMASAYSMGMPGPYAMAAAYATGPDSYGSPYSDSQMIDVAGVGMGKDKTYKMLPGELLAVYSTLKDKGSQGTDEFVKSLKEKYGLDVEVKKNDDGKSEIINKATGNVIIGDGNGNNIMEEGDLKFKEAFDKLGINMDDFKDKDGKDKLNQLTQSVLNSEGLGNGQMFYGNFPGYYPGMGYGPGMGFGTGMGLGMGMGMGYNPLGSSGYNMMNPYGGYGTNPYGMQQQGGIMNNPAMMKMMMMYLMMALQYSMMMQQYSQMGYKF